MGKNKIVFVTGNANKLKEVQAILGSSEDSQFIIESRTIDLPELQGTLEEVSREKCRAATEIVGGPVITEDTALCFDALNGLPGPYIKWFMKSIGHDGLNKMLDGFSTRTAAAVCTFAYSPGPSSTPGVEPEIILFQGRTVGSIVPARGPARFGWDPIFEEKETGKTFAELDPVVKNKISHRYKAVALLKEYLEKL